MFRRFALAALPALFACAPAITHGPRVEPGPSLMLTGGMPRPLCTHWADCHGGATPTLGAGVRYGFVPPRAEAAPVLVGLTVPVLDPLGTELDAFVQAPAEGAWVWGGGALASVRHLMPYMEAGRMPAGGGNGWYLSAGYAHLLHNPLTDFRSQDGSYSESMARAPRWFAPGAGARVNFRGVRYTVFANGAFGSFVERIVGPAYGLDGGEGSATIDTRKRVRTLMVGITWEVPFRDVARRRNVPAPRPIPEPH